MSAWPSERTIGGSAGSYTITATGSGYPATSDIASARFTTTSVAAPAGRLTGAVLVPLTSSVWSLGRSRRE